MEMAATGSKWAWNGIWKQNKQGKSVLGNIPGLKKKGIT
jgi:hypothetical protein